MSVFCRPLPLVFRNEFVSVNDHRAAFAFHDGNVKRCRLFESQPNLTGKGIFNSSAPKQENGDAGIGAPRTCIFQNDLVSFNSR